MDDSHGSGVCCHCKIPVHWDSNDNRASSEGSFVDVHGNFECTTLDENGNYSESTWLHQG